MRHAIILLASLLCISACTSAHFVPLSGAVPYHKPVPLDQVELLQELPERPYTELGSVFIRGHYFNLTESMINRLKQEAGEHGADAVIIYRGINTDQIFSSEWYDSDPRNTTGIAIRYKDAS